MLSAFLIALREVIEASLIVVTICTLLSRSGRESSVKTVMAAALAALVTSIVLVAVGSIVGGRVQELYKGRYEPLYEGVMMLISGVFMTTAIIWIHRHFASHKVYLIKKINESVALGPDWTLALLVYTTVLREGVEICGFLTTLYMTSRVGDILTGCLLGIAAGVVITYGASRYAVGAPIYQVFRVSTALLIISGATMISGGIGEIVEYGLLPAGRIVTLWFLPPNSDISATYIQSFAGVSRHMNVLQICAYVVYTATMCWYVTRPSTKAQS